MFICFVRQAATEEIFFLFIKNKQIFLIKRVVQNVTKHSSPLGRMVESNVSSLVFLNYQKKKKCEERIDLISQCASYDYHVFLFLNELLKWFFNLFFNAHRIYFHRFFY